METALAGMNDDRCAWSDLYVNQCAHCLGHGDWQDADLAWLDNDPEYRELR